MFLQFTMRVVGKGIYHLCCLGEVTMAAQASSQGIEGYVFRYRVSKTFILSWFQHLLVSGGYAGGTGSVYTDTTEIFDGNTWTNVGRLPWGVINFPIINVDNKILSFGINF